MAKNEYGVKPDIFKITEIRFQVGRNFIINDKDSTWRHLGRIAQIKNTRIWETKDRIGIVRPGNSSDEVRTWLSQIENDGARNGNYERNVVVKNQATKQRVQRTLGDCRQWEANGQCSKRDNCSFHHDINKRGKVTPSTPIPNSFMQQNERNASRTRRPRGKSRGGRMSRWPCKDHFKRTCTNSCCEKWHTPECLFYKFESGYRFEEHAHRQVDEQPRKKSKKNDDQSAVVNSGKSR